MATTRWADREIRSLDGVLDRMLKRAKEDAEKAKENVQYNNFRIEPLSGESHTISFNNKEIEFNYVSFSYDAVSNGDEPIEDRTKTYQGYIIIYNDEIKISYIINQNSNALRILRVLVDYTGKNEIKRNSFDISSDFFIWLINRVFNEENALTDVSDDENGPIIINSIIGLRGDTEDLLSRVATNGDSVMNILSTLSFLLESKQMKQIKVRLECAKHENIELVLNTSGTVDINLKEYIGCFENDEIELQTAKLFLFIYIELLPKLKQQYLSDMDNGIWNSDIHKKFLGDVAKKLQGKIEDRIKSLAV